MVKRGSTACLALPKIHCFFMLFDFVAYVSSILSLDMDVVWNRLQNRIDDQRGMELNCDMPDFLLE